MNQRSFIWVLLLLRLCSALPFSIFYSSLELYLLKMGMPTSQATALVGSILALSFSLSLLGGYLSGRYISNRAFFLMSLFCQSIGCFAFAEQSTYFLWLCAVFLLGNVGLNVSLNMLMTRYCQSHVIHSDNGFFWYYMSLNLGYFFGYFIAGHYSQLGHMASIPLITSLFSLVAVLMMVLYWNYLKELEDKRTMPLKVFFLMFLLIFFITRWLLSLPIATNTFIIVCWIVASVVLYVSIKNKLKLQTQPLNTFYLLMIASLLFWSMYFISPMALMAFIKTQVNLTVLSMAMPPQWIQIVNVLTLAIGTIIFTAFSKQAAHRSVATITRYACFSLGFVGLGYIVLLLGLRISDNQPLLPVGWVIISYIFQGIGELFIGPLGFSLAGRLIPSTYQSRMMGLWVTIVGVASAISSNGFVFSAHMSSQEINRDFYAHFFFIIAIVAMVSALVIYGLSYWIIQREQPLPDKHQSQD